MESPTPAKMVTSGVTRMSTLVSLLTALPSSAATIAMMSTASGPPAPAQRIGRVAHGDQAEQHQRRAMQCPTDSAGHGGAAHGRSIAAQIHQQCKTGLLTHRLDDGTDEQTGKQTLCHCAQCVNEVTLRRDDDILPRQKFFQLRHKTCLSIQNRSLRLRTYVLYHTIHLSRQQEVAGKNVKFRLCAMFCPAGTYSIWNIFRHTAPVENLCRSPLCR